MSSYMVRLFAAGDPAAHPLPLVPYTGIAGIDADLRPPLRPAGAHRGGHGAAAAGDSQAPTRATRASARPLGARPQVGATRHEGDYTGAVERAGDDLRDLRIGIITEGFSEGVGAEAETCDAVRAAAERLAGLGAELYERSLPEHLQAGGVAFAGFVEGMTALMTSGGNGIGWRGRYWEELAPAIVAGLRGARQRALAAGQDRARRGRPPARAPRRGALCAGTEPTALAARGLRPGARRASTCCCFPTTPFRAFRLDDELSASERVLRGWANLGNTYPTDMSGHPAISLPLAQAGGLPVGVMLVGHRVRRRAPARDRRHLRARARLGPAVLTRRARNRGLTRKLRV